MLAIQASKNFAGARLRRNSQLLPQEGSRVKYKSSGLSRHCLRPTKRLISEMGSFPFFVSQHASERVLI